MRGPSATAVPSLSVVRMYSTEFLSGPKKASDSALIVSYGPTGI